MGIWDDITSAVSTVYQAGASAVGRLREEVGEAWDTAKEWVQTYAVPGAIDAYTAAVQAMNAAQAAVSQQFKEQQAQFERAQVAQNVRDAADRARATVQRVDAVNTATTKAAQAIEKAREVSALISEHNERIRQKAAERKARLEAEAEKITAIPAEVRTVADSLHKEAIDVLTGLQKFSPTVTTMGGQQITIDAGNWDKMTPEHIDHQLSFLPGVGMVKVGGAAGRVAAHEIGNVLAGKDPRKLIELFGKDPDNVVHMINKLKAADKVTVFKALEDVPEVKRIAELGTVAERTAARRINEVLDSQKAINFMDFWKTDRKAAVKVFNEMSTELKDDFLRVLWKSPTARPIAAELQAKNVWAAASLPKKAALAAFGAGTVVSTLTLPIFAIFEPIQNYNMLTFARKAVEQAKGEYPPDISFKLRSSEKTITDLQWKIKDAMKRKQYDLAAEYLVTLRHALDEYIAFREEKRDVMHPEDYTNTQALVDSAELFIKDIQRQLEGEAPTLAQVEFDAKQAGAKVQLSGRSYNYKPYTPYSLSGGRTYTYTASAPGYKTRTGSFWVDPYGRHTETVDLEPGTEAPGKVNTSSLPEAEIWMGGIDTGFTTPHTFELPPGTYDFAFHNKGYKTKVRTATVWAGEEKTLDVILEEEWTERDLTMGYVSFDTEPMGAHVFINGAVQDWPTPTKVDLDPGEYAIIIKKTGYEDIEDTVTVEAGQTYIKSYELVEKVEPDVWRVHVSSEPAGAKILVDDFFTGAWTPGFVDLLTGSYVIGVQKTGFEQAEEVIDVG